MDASEHTHAAEGFDAREIFVRSFLDRAERTTIDRSPARDKAVLVERRARLRGVMPPLHARDVDETYYVLEGTLTFFIGGETVTAGDGQVVVVARGCPRTFRVESEGARWLLLTRVASPARFEDFGRALAKPCRPAGWSAEDANLVTALGAANAVAVLGPPGMLPPR
jgi:mannose-6-phosphate isomerase-like protein (cupin superfamily)